MKITGTIIAATKKTPYSYELKMIADDGEIHYFMVNKYNAQTWQTVQELLDPNSIIERHTAYTNKQGALVKLYSQDGWDMAYIRGIETKTREQIANAPIGTRNHTLHTAVYKKAMQFPNMTYSTLLELVAAAALASGLTMDEVLPVAESAFKAARASMGLPKTTANLIPERIMELMYSTPAEYEANKLEYELKAVQ